MSPRSKGQGASKIDANSHRSKVSPRAHQAGASSLPPEVTGEQGHRVSGGYVVRAQTEEELISKAQQHASEVHEMLLTRDQALAMARPA